MREPPSDLSELALRSALDANYALTAADISFLPVGHDARAWAYRADTPDGASHFLKVRERITNEAALVVPHFLHDHGIEGVVAPLATEGGALWATADRYVVIVYPYIEAPTGMAAGLSDRQWIEYGATLRQVHDTAPTATVEALLRRDDFVPDGAATLRALDQHVGSADFEDAGRKLIARFWLARRELIRIVVERTEELGRRIAESPPRFVLCHADIHTNNVLRDGDEHIWIVDWDETMLAPRERDLMFVIGGIGPGLVSRSQEELFFDGYGDVEVDPVALAYYRCAWATSDIGAYGEQIFLREDLGPLDRREAVERFQSLFEPGSIVDIALGGTG